jgi:succinoglycan biosynthesis transport protein ExoP
MTHATLHPQDVLRTIRRHAVLLATPIAVLTGLAVAYALVRPATWEASQALVVRSETGDTVTRIGRATQLEEMKSTQETVLELAKSRGVLVRALTEVGPPAGKEVSPRWPDEAALESVLDNVSVEPPKGAEFGKTEVFYLKVKDKDPHRAIALAAAIAGQLRDRLAGLQETTSQEAIEELTHSANLARSDLAQATQALRAMEQRVGNDLAELRILSDSPSGDSDLRRNLVELEKELRGYEATQVENQQSLALLQDAQQDPEKLLAAPNALLRSQPALARLKDGLVDAQLRTSQALGTMSDDHPQVVGAREAERVIREQLYNEIAMATKGVQADLQVDAGRIASLKQQIAAIQTRLSRLVELRAEYANLNDAVKSRSETLKSVEHELANAQAKHAAALATSRLSLIDNPDIGTRPVGPGRSVIAAGGFGAGLLLSSAIAFLLIHPTPVPPAASVEVAPTAQPQPSAVPTVALPAEHPTLRLAKGSDTKPVGPLTLGQALARVAG